ncbi:hypothetical protein [Microbacterium sp. gxy059]|uniref:PH-like domain-containing protein n=1 Tax=Microbacterium sp. gxy059 TaxID=2957199 RepID=UPI003D9824F9
MTREVAGIVMLALAVIGLALMLWGWRRRRARDAGVRVPTGAPTGAHVASFSGFYVATTRRDAPLDRITARPLAFRAQADIEMTTDGLALALPGEETVFIPAGAISGVGRATWTIDRVVERDGLVVVSWTAADAELDTYLRLQDDDPSRLIEAVSSQAATDTSSGATR